jgi:hypothetical protein
MPGRRNKDKSLSNKAKNASRGNYFRNADSNDNKILSVKGRNNISKKNKRDKNCIARKRQDWKMKEFLMRRDNYREANKKEAKSRKNARNYR